MKENLKNDSGKGRFHASHAFIGLIIMLLGVMFLISNLGLDMKIDIGDFWPLILIFIGVHYIARPRHERHVTVGLIWLTVGAIFLLDNLAVIDFSFDLVWPIIIILIGLSVLRHGFVGITQKQHSAGELNIFAVLGGGEYDFSTTRIQRGKATVIMGGGEIDLRNAEIVNDTAVLSIIVLMGGLELYVPKNWKVVFKAAPILGGIDNKTEVDLSSKNMKTLIIEGMILMGGIEVHN